MLRCLTLCVATTVAMVATAGVVHADGHDLPPGTVTGGGGDAEPTFDGGSNDDGTIDAGVDVPGSNPPPSAPPTYGPTCTWTAVTEWDGDSDLADIGGQVANEDGQLGWIRRCGNNEDFVWVTPSIDPVSLIPGAADRARRLLPLPTPDMSPAPDVGSVVNLGLWFAIIDPVTAPGSTTARASVGNAWAEVTGSFSQVSIDPGTGDPPVTCDGFGVPYPQGANDPDQGPCGYTYRQRSPDGAPYQLTYTITYDLTWRTSDGQSGTLSPVTLAAPFDYVVLEIQTVGTA